MLKNYLLKNKHSICGYNSYHFYYLDIKEYFFEKW